MKQRLRILINSSKRSNKIFLLVRRNLFSGGSILCVLKKSLPNLDSKASTVIWTAKDSRRARFETLARLVERLLKNGLL